MTRTEINKRKAVTRKANMQFALSEQREAGKRYFEAAAGSREEGIAWDDFQWANTKVNALIILDAEIKAVREGLVNL